MSVGTLSRNHIIGIILFLEIAAIAAFIWFYAMPVNTEISTVEVQIQNKQRDVREIEDTKRKLAQTTAEIDRLNKDINRLEKYFSEEVYIPRTLQLLENLARATGMEIISIKPVAEKAAARPPVGAKAPAPKSTGNTTAKRTSAGRGQAGEEPTKPKRVFNSDQEYRTTTIDVALSGKFKNLNDFLSELSYFPKLVVVNKLDLTLQTSTTQGPVPGQNEQVAVETASGGFNLNVKMPMVFYIQKKTAEEAAKNEGGNKSLADGIKQGIDNKRNEKQAGNEIEE